MVWGVLFFGLFAHSGGPRVLTVPDVLNAHTREELMDVHYQSIATSPLILRIRHTSSKYRKFSALAKTLADQNKEMLATSRLKFFATDSPTTEYLLRGSMGFTIAITAFNLGFRNSSFYYDLFEKYFSDLTRVEQLRAGALVLLYQDPANFEYLGQLIGRANWSVSIARLSRRIRQEGVMGSAQFVSFLDQLNSNVGVFRRCQLILSGVGR